MPRIGVVSICVVSLVALLFLDAAAGSAPGPIQLTKEEEGFICPAFSPDGRHIAVTRIDWSGIWILSPDGTGLRQLTADRGAGYRFAWSPDGRHIAYRAEEMVDGHRYFAIRIMDAQTGQIEEMTDFQRFLGLPRWVLGDGTVVFETDRMGTLAQAQVRGLVSSGDAVMSQDRVAITSRDLRIWIADAFGEGRIVVSAEGERCFDPLLSPDGARVCYSVLSAGGSIAVAGVDGSEHADLGYGSNPSWSPDGRHLVYEITADDGMVITGSDLFIVAADGTGRIQLTDTPDTVERWPSWSPDGEKIVFSASGSIYTLPTPASSTWEE